MAMASSPSIAARITHTKRREMQLIIKPSSNNNIDHNKPLVMMKATRNTSIVARLALFGSKKCVVRCTATDSEDNNDAATSTTTTTTTTEEKEEEWEGSGSGGETSPAEVGKGSPSLISALNVEKALRGIAITDADHYGRLGLRMGCSFDQVRIAYQDKVNELMNQGLDEEELNKQQELLKESYTILSSEKERRIYDWSLARSENPERYAWPFEVDITQTPKGTPPPPEPEDVGPTRLVGYFLLGWLVLAFTLSIALNL